MSLSVCFLTRNEEHVIERAIRSVLPVADQVVVVDTGSSDRTAEIAAGLGATLVSFTWGDDFAAGRNFTLRHASGQWVLWMNGSEELLPAAHAPLRASMNNAAAFGFFIRIQNVTDPERPEQFAETADLRLFRRPAGNQDLFVGRLHPHVRHDVVADVTSRGQSVLSSDVVLRNYAEASPPTESKLRFNARLLELELHERPGQLHYLIEYGRVLRMLKDDPAAQEKAQAALTEAAAIVAGARDAPSPPSLKVQVLLNDLLASPPAQRSTGESAASLAFDDVRELSLRWFPASPNLLWTVAEQSFKRRDYAAAAAVLRRLLDLGRSGRYDRSHRFDPRILGEDALMNLGACYLQMRKLDEAEACFVQLTTSQTWGRQASRHLATAQRWRKPS